MHARTGTLAATAEQPEEEERRHHELLAEDDTFWALPMFGDLQRHVDDAYSSLKRISVQKTDQIIADNAANMINSIGVSMLNSLHDSFMPRVMRRFVDAAYGTVWPEVKKSLLDSILFDMCLEFHEMKEMKPAHDAQPPTGWFKGVVVRFIYAMEPYDLSIWGTIRSPVSLCLQLTFLFPFYGVSDTLVIALAFAKYTTQYSEYGLVMFIVSAKNLQFVTGLVSGTVAFTKLFVCATLREDAPLYPYFSCQTFAPGVRALASAHGTRESCRHASHDVSLADCEVAQRRLTLRSRH
jgi:hypothetical protein